MRAPATAVVALAVIVAVVTSVRLVGQEPPRQVFRGAVDLVTIMVYVVDADGRPVPGLAPEDFTVELDGVRRPVRALDYRETVTESAAAATTTNAGPDGPGRGGRSIMVLIDDVSFRTSSSDLPSLRKAVQGMVAGLSTRDRIGLATTSGRGPLISPTGDHQRVTAAIQRVNGTAPAHAVAGFYVTIVEALEILRSGFGAAALEEVNERECGLQRMDISATCLSFVEAQARIVLDETRDRTALQVRSYQAVLSTLAEEPRPRILVLISDGIASGSAIGFTSDLTRIAEAAAEANVQLYVVMGEGDNAMINEGSRLRIEARSEEIAVLHDGIESVAGSVGGALFRLVGSSSRPFDRMLRESSGVYELGVDAPPGGRARLPEVVVSVNKPDVTVRANRRALVPTVAPPRPSVDNEVRRVLTTGAAATGVPMSVATSSRLAPGGKELQLAVDLAVPDSAVAPLRVSFAVVNDEGRVVKSGAGAIEDAPRDGEYRFAFAVPLPEGRYAVRVALSDPDGRVGGVEHVVTLALEPMGRLLASDLQTGWVDRQGTSRFLALSRLPAEATAADINLELYPADRSAPSGSVTVRVDVGEVGREAPLATSVFVPEVAKDRWQLRTSIPVESLPVGLFTVTATVLDDGTPVGSRTTTLEKVEAPPVTSGGPSALPSRRAVLDALATELVGAARRPALASLIEPAEVRAHLRSLAAAAGEPVPPALVAAGAPDTAFWDAMSAAAREQRTALGAFARGLLALRLPNGPAAATQFELAVERAPASIAAMLYLGAAWAASGKDDDAAGIWQLALGEPGVGLDWHLCQIDALVRIGDRAAALVALRTLAARYPDSTAVLARLVEVELAQGLADDARPHLSRLLEINPDDPEARWWEIVMAFADAVDPARPDAVPAFLAVADRYIERNWPRTDLVRSWRIAVSG